MGFYFLFFFFLRVLGFRVEGETLNPKPFRFQGLGGLGAL